MNTSTKFVAAIATTLISLSTFGCRQISPKRFDDTIFQNKHTQAYTIATGYKGIYVLRGKYTFSKVEGTSGMLIRFIPDEDGQATEYFVIRDFVNKYPMLATPDVRAEATKQDRLIEKAAKHG